MRPLFEDGTTVKQPTVHARQRPLSKAGAGTGRMENRAYSLSSNRAWLSSVETAPVA
jgi:hypothetical protein